MPLAIEQLDMSGHDVILSSSHAVAKGILTGPDQLHISYVHSPIRYAWDLQHQYLRESGLSEGLKDLLQSIYCIKLEFGIIVQRMVLIILLQIQNLFQDAFIRYTDAPLMSYIHL